MKKYIDLIINLSKKAYSKDEIPVGCIIVKNNKIVSKGYNTRQHKNVILGHAEVNAILKAENKMKDWRLNDCEMYVSLQPCDMCCEIIKAARIKKVYFLLKNNSSTKKFSFCEEISSFNEEKSQYLTILQQYFKPKRK